MKNEIKLALRHDDSAIMAAFLKENFAFSRGNKEADSPLEVPKPEKTDQPLRSPISEELHPPSAGPVGSDEAAPKRKAPFSERGKMVAARWKRMKTGTRAGKLVKRKDSFVLLDSAARDGSVIHRLSVGKSSTVKKVPPIARQKPVRDGKE